MTISSAVRCWWTKKRANLEPGRCWLALASVVIQNVFVGSQEYVFSFLYDDLIERFESTRTKIGGAYSAHWILFTLPSLLISPLVSKYGCRNVGIASFFAMGLGYSLCDVCHDVGCFYFFFGFLAGIGSGGTFLTTSTYIQQAFVENRGVASAIGSLGFAIGGMVIPSYIKLLQDTFGTTTALLLHGGLCFHGMLLSFAFRGLPRTRKSSHERRRHDTEVGTTAGRNVALIYVVQTDLETSEVLYVSRPARDSKTDERPGSAAGRRPERPPERSEHRSGMARYLRDVLDLTLFKDGCLMIATTHFMLYCLGRYGILAQITSATRHRGFTSQSAAFLLTASGFAHFVSTLLVVVLMNISAINPIVTSICAALLICSCGFLIAFSRSYGFLMTGAILLGAEEAVVTTNIPLLTVHLVGVDRVTRGVSMLLVFLIPASVVAAPFTAWLVELTGNYVLCFLSMGIVSVASAALGIIVYVLFKRRAKKRQKSSTTHATEASSSSNPVCELKAINTQRE